MRDRSRYKRAVSRLRRDFVHRRKEQRVLQSIFRCRSGPLPSEAGDIRSGTLPISASSGTGMFSDQERYCACAFVFEAISSASSFARPGVRLMIVTFSAPARAHSTATPTAESTFCPTATDSPMNMTGSSSRSSRDRVIRELSMFTLPERD